jgi:hypothetical protein
VLDIFLTFCHLLIRRAAAPFLGERRGNVVLVVVAYLCVCPGSLTRLHVKVRVRQCRPGHTLKIAYSGWSQGGGKEPRIGFGALCIVNVECAVA